MISISIFTLNYIKLHKITLNFPTWILWLFLSLFSLVENQSKNFIVQNHVDLTSSSNATQGLKNDRKRYKRSFSHERHIEIMVVADDKMAKYHGDNLHQYILSLMATVSTWLLS